MNHNRMEILCPAQIKFDSPNTFFLGLIKSRNRIFKYPAIVVMSAMGNNSAPLQAFHARNGLWPVSIKIIYGLPQARFYCWQYSHIKSRMNPGEVDRNNANHND
jgi:hypothetical protein